MVREKNCTTAQLAIAWVLAQGEDIVPLVGMSHRARSAENLQAFDVTLTKEDINDLPDLCVGSDHRRPLPRSNETRLGSMVRMIFNRLAWTLVKEARLWNSKLLLVVYGGR
jgi:hypothetical protein